MGKLFIKQGDNARGLQDSLKINDSAIDLTGASSIVASFRKDSTVVQTNGSIVGSAVDGVVACSVPSGVYDVPGQWKQEWVVTYSNSAVIRVPSRGFNYIVVLRHLAIP